MFGTVLSFVSLRLLGMSANQGTAKAAREWILTHGGATAVPSWGKFWLAVLGVYEWCALAC
jgi:squalene cyclase